MKLTWSCGCEVSEVSATSWRLDGGSFPGARRCLAMGCGNWPRFDTCFAQRQVVYLAANSGIDWCYWPRKLARGRRFDAMSVEGLR
jgi:hypothetical protein